MADSRMQPRPNAATTEYFGLNVTVSAPPPSLAPVKKRSQAWKAFEKEILRQLHEHGFNATRDNRGDDYGRSGFEIIVAALPFLKIDCKYTEGGWAHHSKIEKDIIDKYCIAPGDEPVMPTKSKRQPGSYTTIRTPFFLRLLQLAFFPREAFSGRWACTRCGQPLTMTKNAISNLHRYDCPRCGLTIYSESEPQRGTT